ncbi:hypothetical protein ABK040_002890 [Willaertia magna]
MNRFYQIFEKQLNETEELKVLSQVYLINNGQTKKPPTTNTSNLKPTTTIMKKEKEQAFLSLVNNKDSNEMGIILLEYDIDNNIFRIGDFHLLKKNDFGIKIVDELHFDIFFREKALVYNFESGNINTQWSVVTALIKACKFINDQQNENTTSESNLLNFGSNQLNNQDFVEVLKQPHWSKYYIDKMQKDSSLRDTIPQMNDISIDMFKKTTNTVNGTNSKTNTVSENILKSATINNTEQQETLSRKDNWIQKQLKLMEEEFTEIAPISIVICTWNVNNKFPSNDSSLSKLFHLDEFEADIYAIGFQEIDMTAGALLREETEIGGQWSELLLKTFNERENRQHKYELITARQLVGIYHCIFVKETLLSQVKEVMNSAEGCGVLGMMGNKGGVGIRFKLFDSTFCFINSHLAPHQGAIERRNQNFHDILRRTEFGDPQFRPEQHDFFFWLGDLNYRISQPNQIVREKIKQQDYKFLLKYDQLSIEKNANNVFVDFIEGEINFDPTYKFDAGTDTYDTSEKGRVPSYTDRILWKENKKNNITQKFYTMHKEYKMSDHKPVISSFEVGVKKIVEEKYRKCYHDIIKMLDKLENDMLPEVSITGQSINFVNVKYNEPMTQSMVLKNTGQVVCEYTFVPKPHETLPSKPYITIEPMEGYIIPGETEEIKITILVNSQKAPKLLKKEDVIDDILILHLKNGRDHFVSITGNYVPSSFGSSLEELVKQKNPIVKTDQGLDLSAFDKDLVIPKELWRMIDLLYHNGMKEEGIFKYRGTSKEVNYIRECLDTGAPFVEPVSNHSVAEALMSFLESLSEPVIPFKFYHMCLHASSNASTCYQLINMLPEVHYNCFHYLMSFLRELLKHKNSLTLEEVAIIFSRVLIRTPNENLLAHNHESTQYFEEQKAKAQFIGYFLKDNKIWAKDDIIKSDILDDFVADETETDSTTTQSKESEPLLNHNNNNNINDSNSKGPTSSSFGEDNKTLSADEFY